MLGMVGCRPDPNCREFSLQSIRPWGSHEGDPRDRHTVADRKRGRYKGGRDQLTKESNPTSTVPPQKSDEGTIGYDTDFQC
jgi:hypothetical protein